jgi:sodium/proline symporter
MLWVGRIVVLIISIAALLLALLDKKGSIMSLVSNAWGIFGAAFGPVILLSLYWRRFNFPGALAAIAGGAVMDLVWLYAIKPSVGIYELLPAFIFSLLLGVAVTLLTKAPNKQVTDLFDKAKEGHNL